MDRPVSRAGKTAEDTIDANLVIHLIYYAVFFIENIGKHYRRIHVRSTNRAYQHK
jgi:hypothetical protein